MSIRVLCVHDFEHRIAKTTAISERFLLQVIFCIFPAYLFYAYIQTTVCACTIDVPDKFLKF